MSKPQLNWTITPEQMLARWFAPALVALIEELVEVFDQAMDSSIWDYDRATQRRNGTTVTSPRSITDTGELKNSLVIIKVADLYYQMVWQAAHAAVTLLGRRRADGTNQPGRDWTKARSEIQMILMYAEKIKSQQGV
jgi:hypothetical protein